MERVLRLHLGVRFSLRFDVNKHMWNNHILVRVNEFVAALVLKKFGVLVLEKFVAVLVIKKFAILLHKKFVVLVST